ncbi:hypothetical protein CC85DRAFT_139334 [Cutaneotrichosporon oleaginosum]|uniref:Uncharacterized protein n=1 Tax=Cutaneotrichosporon oleaginosum TaxID=879819 RepID=A0A0J0XIB1_9TREE|nr:uncharacterized protein CC85DRAFT_139334 [Cutaneotrichosporon oleaginosum]KLT40865.1 hypothetical protein CC85DRAFT_139334 [Cutaneotrichosporon oleaginosum]TXT09275.1 hypothetical protein COLE_03209 [Cutaneotrichosporon oleaginosum]
MQSSHLRSPPYIRRPQEQPRNCYQSRMQSSHVVVPRGYLVYGSGESGNSTALASRGRGMRLNDGGVMDACMHSTREVIARSRRLAAFRSAYLDTSPGAKKSAIIVPSCMHAICQASADAYAPLRPQWIWLVGWLVAHGW